MLTLFMLLIHKAIASLNDPKSKLNPVSTGISFLDTTETKEEAVEPKQGEKEAPLESGSPDTKINGTQDTAPEKEKNPRENESPVNQKRPSPVKSTGNEESKGEGGEIRERAQSKKADARDQGIEKSAERPQKPKEQEDEAKPGNKQADVRNQGGKNEKAVKSTKPEKDNEQPQVSKEVEKVVVCETLAKAKEPEKEKQPGSKGKKRSQKKKKTHGTEETKNETASNLDEMRLSADLFKNLLISSGLDELPMDFGN